MNRMINWTVAAIFLFAVLAFALLKHYDKHPYHDQVSRMKEFRERDEALNSRGRNIRTEMDSIRQIYSDFNQRQEELDSVFEVLKKTKPDLWEVLDSTEQEDFSN